MDVQPTILMEDFLTEDKRLDLLRKSRHADSYAASNLHKGKNRFLRKSYSKVANSVREFNRINMEKLFSQDILDVNILVHGETSDYTVKLSFSGILSLLNEQLEKTNKTPEDDIGVHDVMRALTKAFDVTDVYIHCTCPDFCLEENTKIKLADGSSDTVKNLLLRFKSGEQLKVISLNKDGEFISNIVTDIWISGLETLLIKVILSNGKEIITTQNHKYMLRDGTYAEARDLHVGQSLMPLFKILKIEYLMYNNPIPVYDLTVSNDNNFYVDAGVILHNCYRFGWWALANGISSFTERPDKNNPDVENPKVVAQGPEITNPTDSKGSGCKHCMLVLSNNSWLMKVASVIRNYIQYMKAHHENLYAEKMYPKLYNEEYKNAYQTDFIHTKLDNGQNDEDLDLDTSIDMTNKWAKTKGQWQKGNQYRFKKKEPTIDKNLKQLNFDSLVSDSE